MAVSAIKMTQRNLVTQPFAWFIRVAVAAELAAASAANNPARAQRIRSSLLDPARAARRRRQMMVTASSKDTTHNLATAVSREDANPAA